LVRVFKRLGPTYAYVFIEATVLPMTPMEEHVVEVLSNMFSIAFDESDGMIVSYFRHRDSLEEPQLIPTNPDFVKRVVKYSTYDEVMQEAGV
jgi:hypothetical protein